MARVLVMIPARDEENTVGEVVTTTRTLYPDFHVLVIDDGSKDETVRRAKEAGADVISLPFRCGGSVAVQTAYLVAAMQDFDYLVKIDADGQHRPEEIPKLLAPLFENEADIAVGSRYLTLNSRNDSMVKNSGRIFSSTLVSLIRRLKVTDITSGMRAWNRHAIQSLILMYRERKFVVDAVLWMFETIMASKNGLRLKEVPIEVLPRKHGKSKSFSPTKMLLYPLRLIKTLLEA